MNKAVGKICPYCGKKPVLENSKVVYGKDYGLIYHCRPCKAWVGVHRGSVRPFGRLANEELRYWKKQAHAAFDPIWQAKVNKGWNRFEARNSTYEWLAGAMGLKVEHTHIGMFDVNQCKKVIELCKNETMARKKVVEIKKEEPKPLTRDEAFRGDVLAAVKEHADLIKGILSDYLVTDGAELEIDQALTNLTIAVKTLNFEEEEKKELTIDEVIEAAKDLYEIDKLNSKDLLGFMVDAEIVDYVIKERGFVCIKVVSMEKLDKLKEFVESEIWPHYNDQKENILI